MGRERGRRSRLGYSGYRQERARQHGTEWDGEGRVGDREGFSGWRMGRERGRRSRMRYSGYMTISVESPERQ